MLTELRVRELGVIADLCLDLAPGMTALTGETGTGKTLVVEAIELLLGGRADAVLVRPGADEAVVEGRFVDGRDEADRVLTRRVPGGGGRSRAYVDGAMVPVATLADLGAGLVDLHGQHAHQSLLAAATQRAALDAFAGTDLAPLDAARKERRRLDDELSALGGDARSRIRELGLLEFQLAELDAAGLDDPEEDDALAGEEARLADAVNARDAAAQAHHLVAGDGGAGDSLAGALGAVDGRRSLSGLAVRLRSLQADLTEASAELRDAAEALEDDPERLTEVRARRNLLRDLQRKYGDTLADIIVFRTEAKARREELAGHDSRVADLEEARAVVDDAIGAASAAVAAVRRRAAKLLASAVESRLKSLAMPRARLVVAVDGDGPADDVQFLFTANAGEPPLPLAKVASGGELARAMLALRLTLAPVLGGTETPATLVFDEVDAGVGGEAAVAVGRALAALAANHQVLVVTHLAQVAAFADHQIAVAKEERGGRTIATAIALEAPGRVVELSRMLSGQPGSATARRHAEELLATARQERAEVG